MLKCSECSKETNITTGGLCLECADKRDPRKFPRTREEIVQLLRNKVAEKSMLHPDIKVMDFFKSANGLIVMLGHPDLDLGHRLLESVPISNQEALDICDEWLIAPCKFCGVEFKHARDLAPPWDDDDTWAEIAKSHSSTCRWVVSRAWRLSEPK